ncbi:MAG: glycoside hydrolase family 2 protein, partial [Gemmatimonadales bacterium]|nr:glycoside hydrolase family 2 protein [Gemmatimonadales bacterium]
MTRQAGWLVLLAALAAAGCQFGPEPAAVERVIADGWEFRRAGDTLWMPATVPGTVHTDLLANGVIPDPFYGDNETRLQWIEREDWEYRTAFDMRPEDLARGRHDLVFDGLDTYARVLLNGEEILAADNMFRRWPVDVSGLVRPGENTLEVRFRSPLAVELPLVAAHPYRLPIDNDRGDPPTRVFTRKAAYQYGWDWGARFVTSGVWRPVRLRSWQGAAIEDVWVRQRELTEDHAVLNVQVTLVADTATRGAVTVRSSDAGSGTGTEIVELRPGTQVVTVPFEIRNPERWWPRGMGAQRLYDVIVEVAAGGRIDRARKRIGLRTLDVVTEPDAIGESFYVRVNGVPVFAKGANYIPIDHFTPRAGPAKYRALFEAAAGANMNMLRVWGGGIYEEDRFYDLADEYGVLVWQDFMFAIGMFPGDSAFLDNVRREAEDNVRRLRNHPSIALWCGNNEIDEAWHNWGWPRQYEYTPAQQAEVWGTYERIFHGILPDVVSAMDPGRFYWPSSPSIGWGHPESMTQGDSHYWGIWHGGEPFEVFRERLPRFMSEFGFQAYPDMATIDAFAPRSEQDLASPMMLVHQKGGRGNERILDYLRRWYPEPKDFPAFVYLSQLLQAEGMKIAFEAQRVARPRTMGTLYWQLNDTWPVVSWSSRDYFGRWKAMHYTVRDAFADILVAPALDRDSLVVHVVSDRLAPATGTLRMALLDFDGVSWWSEEFALTVEPNASGRVFGRPVVDLLGDADPRESVLEVSLDLDGGGSARNLLYFVRPNDLRLAADPGLEVRAGWDRGSAVLVVQSRHLAKNVA